MVTLDSSVPPDVIANWALTLTGNAPSGRDIQMVVDHISRVLEWEDRAKVVKAYSRDLKDVGEVPQEFTPGCPLDLMRLALSAIKLSAFSDEIITRILEAPAPNQMLLINLFRVYRKGEEPIFSKLNLKLLSDEELLSGLNRTRQYKWQFYEEISEREQMRDRLPQLPCFFWLLLPDCDIR